MGCRGLGRCAYSARLTFSVYFPLFEHPRAVSQVSGTRASIFPSTWKRLSEYKQLDALLPPALVVSYLVNIEVVVEFLSGFTSDWDRLWQDFYCDWRKLHFDESTKSNGRDARAGIIWSPPARCGAHP